MLGTKKLQDRILKLEHELESKELLINVLDEKLKECINQLEEAQSCIDSMPVDCVRGEWCRSCEFVKSYYEPDFELYGYKIHGPTVYICGKGESCPNFIQKSKGEN